MTAIALPSVSGAMVGSARDHVPLATVVAHAAAADVIENHAVAGFKPVSYTHLDVYKRQISRCTGTTARKKSSGSVICHTAIFVVALIFC